MRGADGVSEPWNAFLKELDVWLECIGGFVVTMLYGMSRATGDLDVLEIAPRSMGTLFAEIAGEGGELHRKHGIYLDYVTVAQAPYDYKSPLREIFQVFFATSALWRPIPMILRSPSYNETLSGIEVMCASWRARFR
jgi:hypothetical protein